MTTRWYFHDDDPGMEHGCCALEPDHDGSCAWVCPCYDGMVTLDA